jgi:amidase
VLNDVSASRPASRPLHYLELHELAHFIRSRAISATEATRSLLARIAALDGQLHSFAAVMADAALDQAARVDARLAACEEMGPLSGVPIAVKDLCWTAGQATAAGMPIHRDFVPTGDATIVSRLRAAGAIIIGKTQLTEGAYSDHHPDIAAPRNPWSGDHWPGISSSGSGVALAAGLCHGAIGTDTGGSIRWPSAANGVTGLKPSWGRTSRHGVFALAPSLDHVGVMARSVRDTAYLLQAIAGSDPLDPTAVQAHVADYVGAVDAGLTGVRVGIDPNWAEAGVDSEVAAALAGVARTLTALGATLVDVTLPDPGPAVAAWFPICAAEAAVAHEGTYPARRAEYGPVLSWVLDEGRALSGMTYQHALLERAAFRGRWAAATHGVDMVLMPVQPMKPLTLETISTLGTQPDLVAALQRFTCPFNLTGSPSLTFPGGATAEGMPIGIQLVAGDLDEASLLRAGGAYQSVTAWHCRHPEL